MPGYIFFVRDPSELLQVQLGVAMHDDDYICCLQGRSTAHVL